MKIFNNLIALGAMALVVSASSCKKDEGDPVIPGTNPGKVSLEFSNSVGSEPITFGSKWYKNENGDSFTLSKFNYYISNIRLNKADGSTAFTEADSYHLIEENKVASKNFEMTNVPAGTYNSITFLIGVDSARNSSGAQTGALDPANGMFWTWSTGYIMVKIEGNSPKSTASGNAFQLHAGGYTGANSVLRTVTLNFPSSIVVDGNSKHVHLRADLLEALKTPNTINFATTNTIMSAGATAKMFADNYTDMLTVTAVE